MQAAIVVKDLGKRYRARDRGRPTSLKGQLLSRFRSSRPQPFWGLRHITFSIARGRAVGVVGLNGAGKSTLLRLIGGVGVPDEGSIRLNGRVGALLDIGAGLSEDLTGRENVYLLGVIAGMLRAEIRFRFDAIVRFAELVDFIDAPVRTYSTGMRMRLAFAVSVHTQPDILLIDEVLAVGDQAFQQKCLRRVDEIRKTGCTIFLVSHDESQIRALCDDVILLKDGRLVAFGPIEETMALYADTVDAKVASVEAAQDAAIRYEPAVALEPQVNRFGSGEVTIIGVGIFNAEGRPTASIEAGEGLSLRLSYEAKIEDSPIVVIGIYADDDTVCFETNSEFTDLDLAANGASSGITLTIERLDLGPGEYRVTVGLFSSDWEKVYDYHAEVYPLTVKGRRVLSKGLLQPPINWEVLPNRTAARIVQESER